MKNRRMLFAAMGTLSLAADGLFVLSLGVDGGLGQCRHPATTA